MNGTAVAGAGYLVRGFGLITKPGIRRYVIIPLLINTLIFSLLIWFSASQFDHLIEWLLPDWLQWLEWLLWPVFALSVVIVVLFTFTLLANLIGAPFNGLLAEVVEYHLTGKRPESPYGFWKDILLSIQSELKKLTYFVSRSIPLLILFVIPGINLAAPFIWLIFNAWMLGLQYLDYPMGNHGLTSDRQRALVKEKRLMALGFGSATMVLLMIPLLNFLAMPIAVAGATAMWVETFSGGSSTK